MQVLNYEEMRKGIRPSKLIWEYFDGDISIEEIVCHALDLVGGWHISSSAKELLKDLRWIDSNGELEKEALRLVTGLNHEFHYRKKYETPLVNPLTNEQSFK